MMHEIVIIIAKYFIVLSSLAALFVWLKLERNQKKTFILEGLIGGLIALALAYIGSRLYHNPRPFVVGHFTPYFSHGNDNGFPSDHMLLASVLAFMCLKYSKLWGWVLIVLAILIGTSRVIAGVHHSIDIIGSAVFAALGITLAQVVISRISMKQTTVKDE